MRTDQHMMMTDLTWDPSGRYIATFTSYWRHQVCDGMFLIYLGLMVLYVSSIIIYNISISFSAVGQRFHSLVVQRKKARSGHQGQVLPAAVEAQTSNSALAWKTEGTKNHHDFSHINFFAVTSLFFFFFFFLILFYRHCRRSRRTWRCTLPDTRSRTWPAKRQPGRLTARGAKNSAKHSLHSRSSASR